MQLFIFEQRRLHHFEVDAG